MFIFKSKKEEDTEWTKVKVEVFNDDNLITIGRLYSFKGDSLRNGRINELIVTNDFYEDITGLFRGAVRLMIRFPDGLMMFANAMLVPNEEGTPSSCITIRSIVVKQLGDRREGFRMKVKNLSGNITFDKDESQSCQVIVKDLSLLGCQIKCKMQLLPERHYNLALYLDKEVAVIPVIIVRDLKNDVYGVRFERQNPAMIDMLSSYLQKLQIEEIKERKRRTI